MNNWDLFWRAWKNNVFCVVNDGRYSSPGWKQTSFDIVFFGLAEASHIQKNVLPWYILQILVGTRKHRKFYVFRNLFHHSLSVFLCLSLFISLYFSVSRSLSLSIYIYIYETFRFIELYWLALEHFLGLSIRFLNNLFIHTIYLYIYIYI